MVGPGFKETEMPRYPEKTSAKILQADCSGRNLRQIDFNNDSKGLRIGGYRAVDWFQDGSFYILETTGVRENYPLSDPSNTAKACSIQLTMLLDWHEPARIPQSSSLWVET